MYAHDATVERGGQSGPSSAGTRSPHWKANDPLGGQCVPGRIGEALRRRRGAGDPLPAALAVELGSGLGADLSAVRIHADTEASGISRALLAAAFCFGPDLYFGEGRYQPGTSDGRDLLVHELSHAVQSARQPSPAGSITIGRDEDPAEREADATAIAVLRRRPGSARGDASHADRQLDGFQGVMNCGMIRRHALVPRAFNVVGEWHNHYLPPFGFIDRRAEDQWTRRNVGGGYWNEFDALANARPGDLPLQRLRFAVSSVRDLVLLITGAASYPRYGTVHHISDETLLSISGWCDEAIENASALSRKEGSVVSKALNDFRNAYGELQQIVANRRRINPGRLVECDCELRNVLGMLAIATNAVMKGGEAQTVAECSRARGISMLNSINNPDSGSRGVWKVGQKHIEEMISANGGDTVVRNDRNWAYIVNVWEFLNAMYGISIGEFRVVNTIFQTAWVHQGDAANLQVDLSRVYYVRFVVGGSLVYCQILDLIAQNIRNQLAVLAVPLPPPPPAAGAIGGFRFGVLAPPTFPPPPPPSPSRH